MIELKNLAKFRRYLLDESDLLVVRGNVSPVISGMHVYNSRYGISPTSDQLMPASKELLCAASLAAVSLSQRESWGWSISFPGRDDGFFVGVEPEGMICVKAQKVDSDRGVVLVQRQKTSGPLTQSHLEPQNDSPVATVQQYFEQVEQTKTRMAVAENGDGVLVHALPDGDFSLVSDLSDVQLFDFADAALDSSHKKDVGEVLVFYECRCSSEIISGMVGNMQEQERQELWGEQSKLDIECPRCGREFELKRKNRSEN